VSDSLGYATSRDRYSHVLPTLQATAMARLEAILGRGDDAAPPSDGDKGSNKGSPTPTEASERPDPSVDRAENGEIGAAYRIPSEPSHASQPSSETPTKRRMRRKKQEP
jgi:hypothetical protein